VHKKQITRSIGKGIIELPASQFAEPVRTLGNAILNQAPGTVKKNLVIAKAAGNSLRSAWILVIHEMEV
jgi:hypothetical protein